MPENAAKDKPRFIIAYIVNSKFRLIFVRRIIFCMGLYLELNNITELENQIRHSVCKQKIKHSLLPGCLPNSRGP